jgi:6-phosphofructokinase 2
MGSRDPVITLTLNPAIDLYGAVDAMVPEHKLRCHDVRRYPGGGGINVARVLQRLGHPALAIFPTGGGAGATLEGLISAEGLAHVALRITAETRQNLMVHDAGKDEQYRFIFPGAALSPGELAACCDAALTRLCGGSWLIASGSLPPSAPVTTYAALAASAKRLGAQFAVDTSGAALEACLAEGPALVKVSARELHEATGQDIQDRDDAIRAAQSLLKKGAGMVAVSRGPQGALLVSEDFAFAAQAPHVRALGTVGAGDSFLAGLVAGLALGYAPDAALELAVAAGSAALLSPGTQLCRPEDVQRLRCAVTAQPVAPGPRPPMTRHLAVAGERP